MSHHSTGGKEGKPFRCQYAIKSKGMERGVPRLSEAWPSPPEPPALLGCRSGLKGSRLGENCRLGGTEQNSLPLVC